MKKDFYPDKTVCSCHLELKKLYKELNKKFTQKGDINFTEFMVEREKYVDILERMYRLSKSIHYKTTKMEKRLLKYRQAIEKLGFKRNE